MFTDITELKQELAELKVLFKVNNLLLSRFILQLSKVRDELHIPKKMTYFKFELAEEDYKELVQTFGKKLVDKALYRLDRTLLLNKQRCPNNIKKYLYNKLKNKSIDNKKGD